MNCEVPAYFDAHCDTLSRCCETGESLWHNSGQCDLQRLSGYPRSGQVFAIFHDSATLPPELLYQKAKQQAALFQAAKREWPQQMRHAALSLEGSELLGCDLRRLETAGHWGVRWMNLTWNHANAVSGSHCDRPEQGLTEHGREFVRELRRQRIVPDVSHLSQAGFWDLMEMDDAPVVASHSNSKALCGHSRNLTDAQFCALRDRGGIVGINLYTSFVGGDGSLDALLRHVEHFLELGGERCLAWGSDWDGGISAAGGLRGVEDMGRLAKEMRRRGYGETLIRQIFRENLARFLHQTDPKERKKQ